MKREKNESNLAAEDFENIFCAYVAQADKKLRNGHRIKTF